MQLTAKFPSSASHRATLFCDEIQSQMQNLKQRKGGGSDYTPTVRTDHSMGKIQLLLSHPSAIYFTFSFVYFACKLLNVSTACPKCLCNTANQQRSNEREVKKLNSPFSFLSCCRLFGFCVVTAPFATRTSNNKEQSSGNLSVKYPAEDRNLSGTINTLI